MNQSVNGTTESEKLIRRKAKWILIWATCTVLGIPLLIAQPTIYLLPGQGSDHRLYQELTLGDDYEVKNIVYPVPYRDMSMRQYAALLSQQIDTTEAFALIGTSLGGMLATEMSTFLRPEKVIIISSAKSRKELPHRYRFQRFIPIYDWIPASLAKRGALLLQPIVEPDRNKKKEIFVSMLKDKEPLFLKRTIQMIIEWDRTASPENIIHIHGNKDHTLPIKQVTYDYLIAEGSHMMALTRSDQISLILRQVLNEE